MQCHIEVNKRRRSTTTYSKLCPLFKPRLPADLLLHSPSTRPIPSLIFRDWYVLLRLRGSCCPAVTSDLSIPSTKATYPLPCLSLVLVAMDDGGWLACPPRQSVSHPSRTTSARHAVVRIFSRSRSKSRIQYYAIYTIAEAIVGRGARLISMEG